MSDQNVTEQSPTSSRKKGHRRVNAVDERNQATLSQPEAPSSGLTYSQDAEQQPTEGLSGPALSNQRNVTPTGQLTLPQRSRALPHLASAPVNEPAKEGGSPSRRAVQLEQTTASLEGRPPAAWAASVDTPKEKRLQAERLRSSGRWRVPITVPHRRMNAGNQPAEGNPPREEPPALVEAESSTAAEAESSVKPPYPDVINELPIELQEQARGVWDRCVDHQGVDRYTNAKLIFQNVIAQQRGLDSAVGFDIMGWQENLKLAKSYITNYDMYRTIPALEGQPAGGPNAGEPSTAGTAPSTPPVTAKPQDDEVGSSTDILRDEKTTGSRPSKTERALKALKPKKSWFGSKKEGTK